MTDRTEKKHHFTNLAINNATEKRSSKWCYDVFDEGREYYVEARLEGVLAIPIVEYSHAG